MLEDAWKRIEAHYRDQPNFWVQPHIDSYNDFLDEGIATQIRASNPILLSSRFDDTEGEGGKHLSECRLYIGGKDGLLLRCTPPSEEQRRIFPNEARARRLTYEVALYADVVVEWTEWLVPGAEAEYAHLLLTDKLQEKEIGDNVVVRRQAFDNDLLEDMARKKVHEELARAVDSRRKLAVLQEMTHKVESGASSSRRDVSGNGVPLVPKVYSTTLHNVLFGHLPMVVQSKPCFLHALSTEIRFGLGECRHDVGGYLIIEGREKAAPLLQHRTALTGASSSFHFQTDAVGSILVQHQDLSGAWTWWPLFSLFRALGVESDKAIVQCIVLDMNEHDDLVDALRPSVFAAATAAAVARISPAKHLALDPYVLGYAVYEYLSSSTIRQTSVHNKHAVSRYQGIGSQLDQHFCGAWQKQIQATTENLVEILQYYKHDYDDNLYALVMDHFRNVVAKHRFDKDMLEFCRSLPDLNRTSFVATIHQLRSVAAVGSSAAGSSSSSSYGFVDPFDGTLALSTVVSRAVSDTDVVAWLKLHWGMASLSDYHPSFLGRFSKVRVNGKLAGVIETDQVVRKLALFRTWRHNGLLPSSISCSLVENRVDVWCDAGRLMRPLVHSNSKHKNTTSRTMIWSQILTGYHEKKEQVKERQVYMSLSDLYDTTETNPNKLARFEQEKGEVEMLDEYETDAMVFVGGVQGTKGATHSELHPSLFLGWSSHHVAFIEHQPADDIRREIHHLSGIGHGGSSLAAVYHSNPTMRLDALSTLLVAGQTPLVQNRLLVQHEDLTYGQNIVVAIAAGGHCYINEGAMQRGLFATVSTENRLLQPDDICPSHGQQQQQQQRFTTTTTLDGDPLVWARQTTMSLRSGSDGVSECSVATRTSGGGYVSLPVVKERDMPFLPDGTRPDVVLSPSHASTVAFLYEMFVGKFAALLGGGGTSTPFENSVFASLGGMGTLLTTMGYHSSGNSILYDGTTGKPMEVEIFVGVVHAMKRLPSPEVCNRRKGPRDGTTRQASAENSVRFDESDTWATLGHGATTVLHDALMTRGDEIDMAVCNTSGSAALYQPSRDLFFSPAVDGPIPFLDDGRQDVLPTVSKDFSVVRVPYAFKLLTQEAQTMGLQMRILTDEAAANIDIWKKTVVPTLHPATSGKIRPPKFVGGMKKHQHNNNNASLTIHLLEEKEKQTHADKMCTDHEDNKTAEPAEATTLLDDVIDLDGSSASDHPIHSYPSLVVAPPPTFSGSEPLGVGTRVCMQAVTDGHPARPWQIVRVGDAFLTVRALDTTNLAVKDQLRVVAKSDIVPEIEIIPFLQQQQMQQQQAAFYSPLPPQQQQQPMVLHISPKFVNGPDNSSSHVAAGSEVQQPPQLQPLLQQDPFSFPTNVGPSAVVQEPQKSSPTSSKDDPFSKGLIIVKKQS